MQRWLTKFKTPLVALLLLVIGMFFLYMLGQIDTLQCERVQAQVTCALTRTWLGLLPLHEQPLGVLRQAEIQNSCDSEGCTYRVYLNADRGGTALGNMYTSDQRGQQLLAARINKFLKTDSQPRLKISTGGGWLLIIPAFLLLAGGIVAVSGLKELLNPKE